MTVTSATSDPAHIGGSVKIDYEGAEPLPILDPPPTEDLLKRYADFRDKRVNPEGSKQYFELEDAAEQRFKELSDDKWVDHAALNALPPNVRDGDEFKFIILGAGYGGLLYAARLVDAGFRAEDIRLIDNAGGWGGTWYWNQYPGLMCDVESAVYMPLLEETNFMPKHRYSYGPELKGHAERIAKQWGLRGLFRTKINSAEWIEDARRWAVSMTENRGPTEPPVQMVARAQFIITANGFLNHPKVPSIRGLGDFQGAMFHTARWDYHVTGGSPTQPSLTGLKGKRVGVIGTGSTAVQIVPEIAKWAKELYVFQRTPTAIGYRGQKENDPEEWRTKIATHKGWQEARTRNYVVWVQGWTAPENLVDDEWTRLKSYSGFMGAPHEKPITPEDVPNHINQLLALDDAPVAARRQRVRDIVKDAATAEALTPWYPTWCKRPTFHDDYLPAFNLPHVHLVDTSDGGIQRATKNGLVVDGKEYEVDILIYSTGYRAPGAGSQEPGSVSNMTFTGRNGLQLSEKWQSKGATTLHGWATHDFPNMILGGYAQMGNGSSATYQIDKKAQHIAYVLAEAHRRVTDTQNLTIEPTEAAEEAWSQEVAKYAGWFSVYGICTPGFATNEGEDLRPVSQDEALKKARSAPYAQGLIVYIDILKRWKETGTLEGVIIHQ
ncbi:hypothetical protein F66182_9696 [Fusarium sp. NRRL 66182]|nr:hypothetical protein F66182_9696 [Fusarium sp. NRRL 66182]